MRLTCPNCDAQYEVPDEVVPASGRDVQCSNCGQTWFHHHPDHMPAQEDPEVPQDVQTEDEEVSTPPPASGNPEPVRRQLDPAVADILRQEADAEIEARQNQQSGGLESQPDLGLDTRDVQTPPARPDEIEQRAIDAKKRMARMRGEPEHPAEAAATAAAISSRRELLPDIEEINSTLRNGTARSGVDAEAREVLGGGGKKKRKRGFRVGFSLVVLIAIALAACYLYAPEISKAVPQADPYLNMYINWVDQMRLALDGHVKNLLGWLDSVASESSN